MYTKKTRWLVLQITLVSGGSVSSVWERGEGPVLVLRTRAADTSVEGPGAVHWASDSAQASIVR